MERRDLGRVGSRHLERALAAVEAMGATDAVVVPASPSPCMLAAGAQAGGVTTEIAALVYKAMILADGG
jgi:sirohydrochlorin ferrochelatase